MQMDCTARTVSLRLGGAKSSLSERIDLRPYLIFEGLVSSESLETPSVAENYKVQNSFDLLSHRSPQDVVG